MTEKRIILMYISEVSGHHSASLAIEDAVRSLSPYSEVLNINAFNYTNPISEKIVNKLYMGVIKMTPRIWDFLYDNPKVAKRIAHLKERIHKLNSSKLKHLFDRFRPDAIACTQAFPCGMVADFKKRYNSDIPLIAVLTDYIPHSYWVYDNVDCYVVPSEEVGDRLIKKGVSPSRIKSFGIPFNYRFNTSVDAKQVYKDLGFSPFVSTVLIMGGGQGLGPIKTIVKSIEKTKIPLQQIIVTGTNRQLYKQLKRKIKRSKSRKRIALFGYTDKINKYMSIADVIITKPGGITTAEALSKKLPMIIIKPIPGQEANNTAYLTKNRAAIKLDNPREINSVLDDLFLHRHKLELMSESAGAISKPHSSLDIAKLLLDQHV